MPLSDEDRRRIEEEEFRRVARERALQSGTSVTTPPDQSSVANKPKSTGFQTGMGGVFLGVGVIWLFLFPPLGLAFLALGVMNLAWANEKSKSK
jgi:hypothetical protein